MCYNLLLLGKTDENRRNDIPDRENCVNKGVEVGKLNSSLRKGKESRISRAKGVIKLERGMEAGLEEERIWT